MSTTWREDDEWRKTQVHRIVAEKFLSDFDPDLQVDHIDGNRLNNAASNLRMVTRGFNNSTEKARRLKSEHGGGNMPSPVRGKKDGEFREWATQKACADDLGVSRPFVTNAVNGRGSAKKVKGWTLWRKEEPLAFPRRVFGTDGKDDRYWDDVKKCAEDLGCSPSTVYAAVYGNRALKGWTLTWTR